MGRMRRRAWKEIEELVGFGRSEVATGVLCRGSKVVARRLHFIRVLKTKAEAGLRYACDNCNGVVYTGYGRGIRVQTLTKLRFSRNGLTDAEKDAFKRLLEEDNFYTIRVPSNVLNPPGKGYILSSVPARCIPRESLDEHFVIHTDGVDILALNYGSAGSCQYPRPLKFPKKWSFNSYTVMKNSEQARRTPTFTEELLAAETGEEEALKAPERSFWSKYWMYLIPLGLIVMNAITQAMNLPEEQQPAGQSASQAPQPIAQRATNSAARRR